MSIEDSRDDVSLHRLMKRNLLPDADEIASVNDTSRSISERIAIIADALKRNNYRFLPFVWLNDDGRTAALALVYGRKAEIYRANDGFEYLRRR